MGCGCFGKLGIPDLGETVRLGHQENERKLRVFEIVHRCHNDYILCTFYFPICTLLTCTNPK